LQSRIGTALLLYVFAALGVFLLVVPWTAAWTQAISALLPPPAGRWALSGWVRGCASGMGALDLALAAQLGVELWRRLRDKPHAAAARGGTDHGLAGPAVPCAPTEKGAAPCGAARQGREASPAPERER